MKTPLAKAIIHTLELAVCFLACWFGLRFLGVDSETVRLLATGALSAYVKLLRADPNVPLADYVNE